MELYNCIMFPITPGEPNQERLMVNAILPEAERLKQNQKARFQIRHADLLSMPKTRNMRQKYETAQ